MRRKPPGVRRLYAASSPGQQLSGFKLRSPGRRPPLKKRPERVGAPDAKRSGHRNWRTRPFHVRLSAGIVGRFEGDVKRQYREGVAVDVGADLAECSVYCFP